MTINDDFVHHLTASGRAVDRSLGNGPTDAAYLHGRQPASARQMGDRVHRP